MISAYNFFKKKFAKLAINSPAKDMYQLEKGDIRIKASENTNPTAVIAHPVTNNGLRTLAPNPQTLTNLPLKTSLIALEFGSSTNI